MMIRSKARKKLSMGEKVKAVREYEESGLSMTEYCRQAGVASSTFSKWARDYAPVGEKLSFVEVGQRPALECEIKLLNGRQVVIRGSYTAKQISALVRELEEC
jgi:transposase-like protein